MTVNNNIFCFKKEIDSKIFYFLNYPILKFKIDVNDKILSKNIFIMYYWVCFVVLYHIRKIEKNKIIEYIYPKNNKL